MPVLSSGFGRGLGGGRAWLRLLAITLFATLAGLMLATGCARAGTWTLVGCTHPDGTPAPTVGWAPGIWAGALAAGSGATSTCATGGALTAVSGQAAQAPAYTGPEWVFTAPPGTTIAGGEIAASLTAPQGKAWIGTPLPAFDPADLIVDCQFAVACGRGTTATGAFAISHPGGTTLYAPAVCVVNAAGCPLGGGVNAEVDIHAADVALAESSTPAAIGISGGLVTGRAHGTADLRFIATDPGRAGGSGPGVSAVTVRIDGAAIYTGPPNPARPCTSLGTDATTGGEMFDRAQPCPASARVTVPVDTTALADGTHRLTVALADAGGDRAEITRRIRTFNPLISPAPPPGEVATRVTTGWLGASPRVTIHSIAARALPAAGQISVRCLGTGCPRLAPQTVPVARAGRLWSALKATRFRAGEKLQLTIATYGRPGERIQYAVRRTGRPRQRLLSAAKALAPPRPKTHRRTHHGAISRRHSDSIAISPGQWIPPLRK